MPILVTGGTGFLGINLVRALAACGHHVRVLARPNSSSNSNRIGLEPDNVEIVTGDVTDAGSIRTVMRGCHEVYHLAAWVQISPWGLKTARCVNVEGTRNVCEAALSQGVRRMIHTSSIATIAAGTLEDPANEDRPSNLAHVAVPYYTTKREAEGVVLEYMDKGLDAVIVNPTYLVGPWDVKPTSGRIIIYGATRGIRFYPKQGGINYVDVRKAAVGHILAMEKGRSGERYILGGENRSFQDYLGCIMEIANSSSPRLGLPYAFLRPFAATGSVLGRLFPSLFRDANLSVLKSAFLTHYVSSEKAHRELGYEVVPINEAVRDAIDWFIEHGYLHRQVNGFRRGRPHTPA